MNFITVSKSVRSVITTLILAYTLSSCNNENPFIEEKSTEAISFSSTIFSRGTPIYSNSELDNFGIFAIENAPNTLLMNNTKVYRESDNSWTYDSLKYWSDVDELSFFGYSPYASTEQGLSVTSDQNINIRLTYEVPSEVIYQPDLMVATPLLNISESSTAVPISLQHALTAIGFSINGDCQKVTEIGINNIYTYGELNLKSDTIAWENLSKSENYYYAGISSSGVTASSKTVFATNSSGYLMMIPQTLPVNAQLMALVDGVERTADISCEVWNAGEIVIYELELGDSWMLADYTSSNYPDTDIWTANDITADDSGLYEGLCQALKTVSTSESSRAITVVLPNLTSITANAFYAFLSASSLTSFKSIILPVAKSVESNAFLYCDDLESIDMPLVTSIGNESFKYCRSLVDVNLPSVKSVGYGAFSYCSSLETITLESVTSISTMGFKECDDLITASFPNLTSIGSESFYSCGSLTNVYMPKISTVTSRLFYFCSSLKEITLDCVTKIESEGFRSCSKLETISLPLLTDIGSQTFYSCSSILDLYFTTNSYRTLTNIGSQAFTYSNCKNATLTIGNIGSKITISGNTIKDYDETDTFTFKEIIH